jgi:hypothetical protein
MAALISIAALIVAWRQNVRNDQSRTAHIDLGVQGYQEGPLDDPTFSTQISATNSGPMAASQVLVFVTGPDGLEQGQGVMRMEPGEIHNFTFQVDNTELQRVWLAFVDGRGIPIERSWTPKSKSWPLLPWALRAMRQRKIDATK